ncbi:hypothetical protein DsansV1_C02g0017061 [Dioscorea sansibarensis]
MLRQGGVRDPNFKGGLTSPFLRSCYYLGRVCHYWRMGRELKGGASLIHVARPTMTQLQNAYKLQRMDVCWLDVLNQFLQLVTNTTYNKIKKELI